MLESGNFGLPPQQAQIVKLAAEGLTDREIAERLSVSISSVHTYWKRVKERLQIRKRSAVIARLLLEQWQETEKRWLEELQRGEETTKQLAAAVDLLQKSLAKSRHETGKRIMERLNEMQASDQKERSLDQMEQALWALRAIVYQSKSVEPFQCFFLSKSAELANMDLPAVTSGHQSVFDNVEESDMAEILSSISKDDNQSKNRFAFLYRLKCTPHPRYFLGFTRNHGAEGDPPTDFSGLAIDVQGLVDQGLLDPSRGLVWRFQE